MIEGLGEEPLRAVFIRAPWVEEAGRASRCLPRSGAIRSPCETATSSPSPSTPSSPTTAGCTPSSWRWRPRRAEASLGAREGSHASPLWREILVRHSTKVSEGDVCTIEGESAAEPLLQAVYEEVLKAGGNPIVNMALEGQSAAYFEHASDAQLRVDLAGGRVGRRERRRAHRGDGEPEHPSALPGSARAPGEAPGGDPAADEASDGAQRRGHLSLGAHPLPDARLRLRGGDGPGRLRGLLLRGLPRDRRRSGRCLGASVRGDQAARRLDPRAFGGARNGRRDRPAPRDRGPQLHRRRRQAQHARRGVLHRPGRGLGRGRDQLPPAGQLRRPRGGGGSLPIRGRQGGRTPPPRRARSS